MKREAFPDRQPLDYVEPRYDLTYDQLDEDEREADLSRTAPAHATLVSIALIIAILIVSAHVLAKLVGVL